MSLIFIKLILTLFVLICTYLLDVDFSVCFDSNDIEFIWCKIKSSILEAMSLYVPKVLKRDPSRPKVV